MSPQFNSLPMRRVSEFHQTLPLSIRPVPVPIPINARSSFPGVTCLPETYSLTAVATDNSGFTATSAPVNIVVASIVITNWYLPSVSIFAPDPVASVGANCPCAPVLPPAFDNQFLAGLDKFRRWFIGQFRHCPSLRRQQPVNGILFGGWHRDQWHRLCKFIGSGHHSSRAADSAGSDHSTGQWQCGFATRVQDGRAPTAGLLVDVAH